MLSLLDRLLQQENVLTFLVACVELGGVNEI